MKTEPKYCTYCLEPLVSISYKTSSSLVYSCSKYQCRQQKSMDYIKQRKTLVKERK